MKKYRIKLFVFAALLNVAGMCSKDDDVSTSASVNPAPVIYTMNKGTWRITFFEDSGTNETTNFAGFNFTFGASSVLTASDGSTTYTGSWSVTSDNSHDDSPSNDLDFNIGFASPPNFEELTEDWNILEVNSNKIRLVHVSGGSGGTDYLTFEKN